MFRISSKILSKVIMSFSVLILLAGMNYIGSWVVGEAGAYFGDTQISETNSFVADFLDFSLSEYSFKSVITLDETVSKNTVIVNGGGTDFQYTLEAKALADQDGFCGVLNLQAKLNGVEQYDGGLMSLVASASNVLGTWNFDIELPADETLFTNGEECQFDVVFKGWQTNVGAYGDGGFSDEERISFTITAGKMVVLNEFLPRPNGIAYGFDFGNDSSDMPQGEWVELYNNSTESINLIGWYTRDETNSDGNKTVITALNTTPATTMIAGKGWLVVYMNKPILNNTGDTVRLFDAGGNLIDSHSYDDPDFCEIEPTPGDDNSTDASGSCGSVPPNKSYARIPDGIGDWVDPIPTPGKVNVLEEEVSPLFSAFVDASGSGAGTEEILIEETVIEETTDNTDEVIVEEEEMIVDEPVTEDEEVITEEDETVIEEEAIIGDDEVVVEEETVVEPEPEPQPSPEAMADGAET